MDNIYLIGDLARKTGLSVDTLNYYLRIGLISEQARSERSGYRLFDDSTVEELQSIIELRQNNVPIKAGIVIMKLFKRYVFKLPSDQATLKLFKFNFSGIVQKPLAIISSIDLKAVKKAPKTGKSHAITKRRSAKKIKTLRNFLFSR